MAGLVDQILLNIKATVTGAAGVSELNGQIGGLTAKMVALNQGVQIVQQVTAAVGGLVGQMGDYARKADAATISARSWQTVLTNFNVNVAEAEQVIGDLVDRTGASEIALKGAAAQYIKMGGTLADFEKGALAAASSWSDLTVKSISLDESISNVTLGIAQGRSELMESSGIVVNASQAWEKYAESVGKSVKELTDQEKARAYAAAVYKEEELGIANLAEKQTDLTRAETASTRAKEEMGRAIGAVILPTYTKLVQASADVARTITDMVNAYRQGGDALDTFAKKNPQLAAAIERVQAVFTALRGVAREVFEQSIQPMLDRLAPQAQRTAAVFGPAFERVQRVLVDLAGIARRAFEQVIIPLFEAVAPVVMRVVQRIVPLLASAGEAFRDYAQMVVTAWQNIALPVIRAIAPYVMMAVDAVGNALGSVIQVVRNVVNAVAAAINGDWSKAWGFLKNAVGTATLAVQSILEGLWKIISDIAGRAWEKAKQIGLNLKDGMIQGLAGLAESLARTLSDALDRSTSKLPDWAKRILGITALQGVIDYAASAASAAGTAAGNAITGRTDAQVQANVAFGNLGNLASILKALGVNQYALSQDFGANPNKHGYGPDGHRGVDYATPMGTSLYAPTGGRLTYGVERDAKGNVTGFGQYLKLIDAQGKQIILAHLSGISKELLEEMRKNGFANVNTGTFLGKTGNSGNSTGPHLHIEIRDAQGRVQNPNRFMVGLPGGTLPVPQPSAQSQVTSAFTPGVTTDVTPPPVQVTAAMIARARELQAALEAAKKAAEAKPGDNALALTYSKAKTALEAWTKQNEAHKDALEAVTGTQGRAAQALQGTYIPTLKDLQAHGSKALQLYKALEVAQRSGSAAAVTAAERNIAAWQGEDKARKAVYDAEVAAYKVRQQNADQAERDATQRAKEQAQLRARIADQNRQLTVSAAQQAHDRIVTLNRAELEAFKGTAAERMEVIRRQTQDEYMARMRVAAATRDKEIREAQNQLDLPQATRDEMIRQARARYENTRLEEQTRRTNQLRDAQAALTREVQETADSTTDALNRVDEYLAGSSEAARAAASALPDLTQNYQNLSDRITELQADLAKKGTAEAWVQVIEDMGRRGELTARQVADLTARIYDLAQSPIDEINRAQDQLAGENERTASSAIEAARALDEMGDREGALRKLDAALTEVMRNGGPIGPALSAIVAEMDRLNASVDQGALRRGAELLERWKAATEDGTASEPVEKYTPTTDAAGTVTGYEANVDGVFSQGMTDVFQGTLSEQIKKAVAFTLSDTFQNAGQEARESFWDEFGLLTEDPEFDQTVNEMGTDVLLGLTNSMGNNPNWAALKAKVDARLDAIFKPGDAQAPSKLSGLIDDVAKAVDDAQAKFDVGAISAEDFSGVLEAQAVVLARVLERLEKLGPEYADAANSVRLLLGYVKDLGGTALKVMQGALKFNEYAGYVQQLAGSFSQLADAVDPGGDLGANLNGIANLTGKLIQGVQGVMQGFAQGGVVGGVVAGVSWLVSTIADAVSGWQRAKQAAEDARKSFQDAFKFIDASRFSTFGTRSRGFFADLFGGGPEVIQEVNQVAASIARTIESGVSGAFSTGIKRFLNGEGDMLTALREGLRDTVVNAVVDAVVQGAVIKGALGKLLTDLTLAAEQQNWNRVGQITGEIGAALPALAANLQTALSPLIGSLNSALGVNTNALNQNTKALNEAQFQPTTIVSYGSSGQSGRLARRLAGAL